MVSVWQWKGIRTGIPFYILNGASEWRTIFLLDLSHGFATQENNNRLGRQLVCLMYGRIFWLFIITGERLKVQVAPVVKMNEENGEKFFSYFLFGSGEKDETKWITIQTTPAKKRSMLFSWIFFRNMLYIRYNSSIFLEMCAHPSLSSSSCALFYIFFFHLARSPRRSEILLFLLVFHLFLFTHLWCYPLPKKCSSYCSFVQGKPFCALSSLTTNNCTL